MASKLETLKSSVGYSASPILPTCGNCTHFSRDMLLPAWIYKEIKDRGWITLWVGGLEGGYKRFESADDVPSQFRAEKNLRCSKHGFAVKKLARCDSHERKQS